MKLIGTSMLLMALSASVHAQHPYDKEEADPRCSSTTFNDLLACTVAAYEKADLALNQQWQSMQHSEAMVEAQRAWISWRDRECIARNAAINGREGPIWHHACMAELTRNRTEQLKQSYRWAELSDGSEAQQ